MISKSLKYNSTAWIQKEESALKHESTGSILNLIDPVPTNLLNKARGMAYKVIRLVPIFLSFAWNVQGSKVFSNFLAKYSQFPA